jgi:hypothetical protein
MGEAHLPDTQTTPTIETILLSVKRVRITLALYMDNVVADWTLA